MRIITKYILREHLSPFIFGNTTIVFIFLLNIVFRDLGKLLGKGLSALIIFEFFFLNLAWVLALTVPMSVLIATLMAFGRLSSDSEIAALKASGFNLYRLITPVFIAAVLLGFLMERFNNCVLPDFNHRVRMLYSDISRKRPTLTLEPHVFFDEIPNYAILVNDLKEKGTLLKEIIINDTNDPDFNKTILAEEGRLKFSQESERMILTLFNGEIHEVNLKDLEQYRRLKFERQVLSIKIPNMTMKRSESRPRGDREKSAKMMREDILLNRSAVRTREERIIKLIRTDLKEIFPEEIFDDKKNDFEYIKKSNYTQPKVQNIERRIDQMLRKIQGEKHVIQGYRRSINALWVEVHKKYSIPVACLVFVLIGAPLGIMTRQGGLATAGGMSILFFLIYWAFLIGGEQLGDRGIINPVFSMWLPNIVVGIVGLYLVIHSVKELTFIPWKSWALWIQKYIIRRIP
jgi:lipopolysaccharide export system permease protein